ncbi:tetratricopeptide repeat protein [Ichthyophthirius multifiliis]|uniref:Tetratricopeptide repeat protein n=1 Tax=Ichthyophthirius multifiliis TaxID=5932 RepID=G0QMZ8_ICHMU|nr:tetratricopeptide repeat protein [Ichthyophthirius multifiliis]EGR33413.1 tetratricopeptide repeat protein [Ichthyophthirius multifiliis]|eukprot:XP_004037399.1 tetratricopeptide repeat protein [Ichthyophthirius multifiliis]
MAIKLYKKSNQLNYTIQVEEKLKKLLFQKGFLQIQQGEYIDILDGTAYESFQKTLCYNLHTIPEQNDQDIQKFSIFLHAYCYLLTYHKNYALEELEKLLKLDDNNVNANLLKGKILWSLNKLPEGNACFWKVENLFPNNTQFLLIKAFIFRKQQEYENSLNNLLLAFHTIRDKSLELEVKNQIALTYNEMGMICFQRQQYDEAIALFNESLQFKANDWGVYCNRGDCYRMNNKIDEALKDYLKAQKIDENREEINTRISMIRNSRGIILFNQKKYEKAIKEFNEAIKFNINISQYYQNRGKCLLELGNLQEAIQDYIKCFQLDPTNTEIGIIVNKLQQESLFKKKDKLIKINNTNDYL